MHTDGLVVIIMDIVTVLLTLGHLDCRDCSVFCCGFMCYLGPPPVATHDCTQVAVSNTRSMSCMKAAEKYQPTAGLLFTYVFPYFYILDFN